MSQPTPDSQNKFRILSLDGGGVRGVLSARVLANIEALLNRRQDEEVPLGKRFDLLAGTSTGGIIALALGIGRSAREVLSFYETHILKIFGKTKKISITKLPWTTRYDPDPLRDALTEFFGETTLEDVSTHVCVSTVSLQNAKPRMYKSGYLERNRGRLDEKLVDIALATSAAPTFFPAHSARHSSNMIDGGLCANNPAMVALVEAMQFEETSKRGISPPNRDLNRVTMLSVGTGEPCAMPYDMDKLKSGGFFTWAIGLDKSRSFWPLSPVSPLIEVLMQSQPQLIHFQANFLLGPENYLRVNPLLKFAMSLDDADKVDDLKNLADVTADIESFLGRSF